MASNLFKLRYLPNADGSESLTALTNTNTAFVHTYLGDDNTGDGTREKPYRSVNKANQKSGANYIVFRGLINEYIVSNKTIVGDDINQIVIGTLFSVLAIIINSTTMSVGIAGGGFINHNLIKDKTFLVTSGLYSGSLYNSLVTKGHMNLTSLNYYSSKVKQSTIAAYIYQSSGYSAILHENCLIQPYINIPAATQYLNQSCIYYSVILPHSIVVVGGVNIIMPTLNDNSSDNLTALRSAIKAAGVLNWKYVFYKDVFDNETCKVIKEQRVGGTRPNVFNKYAPNLTGTLNAAVTTGAKTSITLNVADSSEWPTTGDVFMPTETDYTANGVTMPAGSFEVWTYTSVTIVSDTRITLNGASYTFKTAHNNLNKECTRYGDVLDYTLNPDPQNEALWASDIGGYVGCFRPAYDNLIGNHTTILNVDANGVSQGAGDLMVINENDEVAFNPASTQKWNRMADSTTIHIPLGSNFKGLNAMSTDGSPWGRYLGKHQDLIDTPKLYAGDTLTEGTWYKIFHDTNNGIESAIFYNGIQYLPNYTFYCSAVANTFIELNAGSGTYVRAIKADVLESIEIIPYADMDNPSTTFPRFSAPLMGDCKLIFYTATGAARYGKVIGEPVLFSHLAGANFITDFGVIEDKISYYDNWAISNADQEFFKLCNPSLSTTLKGYFTQSIPTIDYLRREINLHFDEPYDY